MEIEEESVFLNISAKRSKSESLAEALEGVKSNNHRETEEKRLFERSRTYSVPARRNKH